MKSLRESIRLQLTEVSIDLLHLFESWEDKYKDKPGFIIAKPHLLVSQIDKPTVKRKIEVPIPDVAFLNEDEAQDLIHDLNKILINLIALDYPVVADKLSRALRIKLAWLYKTITGNSINTLSKQPKAQLSCFVTPFSKELTLVASILEITYLISKKDLKTLSTKRFGETYSEYKPEAANISKVVEQISQLLHELYATEIIHSALHEGMYKSIGIFLSDHGGFGDIVASLKIYLFLKETLPDVQVRLLVDAISPDSVEAFVKKIRSVYHSLEDSELTQLNYLDGKCSTTPIDFDVVIGFMLDPYHFDKTFEDIYKGTFPEQPTKKDAFSKYLDQRVYISVAEYDIGTYPEKKGPGAPKVVFYTGFDKKNLGHVDYIIEAASRKEVIDYFEKMLPKSMRGVLYESHWALSYTSKLDSTYFYLRSLTRSVLDKPLAVFITPPPSPKVFETLANFFYALGDVTITKLPENIGIETPKEIVRTGVLPDDLLSAFSSTDVKFECLDETESFYEIVTIEGKKPKHPIYLFFLSVVENKYMLALIKYATLPVLVTGDQSLSEAILFKKPFFYKAASWKDGLLENIIKLTTDFGYEDIAQILDNYLYLDPSTQDFSILSRFRASPTLFLKRLEEDNPLTSETKRPFSEASKSVGQLFTDKSLQQKFSKCLRKITLNNYPLHYLVAKINKEWVKHKQTKELEKVAV